MCEDSDDMGNTELTPDSGRIMNDTFYDGFQWSIKTFMPDLSSDEEELSTDKLKQMTKQFSEVFGERHPSSGLKFFEGSFHQAMDESIISLQDPCPLILYIYHGESIAENIFGKTILSTEPIVEYLNKQFVIWPWDRTNMNNYRQFLKLLIESVGSEVASRIASYSYSIHEYPLLVCLSFENGQCTVIHIIPSTASVDEVSSTLCDVHDKFNDRNNEEPITDQSQHKTWFIPHSHLTQIFQQSNQFQEILNKLNIEMEKIINVNRVENIIWSIQYSKKKKMIDNRIGYSQNGQLFYGCPASMARSILDYGFDYDSNRIHGDKYGRGFYFSSERNVCERYKLSDESKVDKKAIIICRILIGKSCLGNSKFETCPNEYDSTTNGSNIFVVYSNEQILPEYLVIYNK